jgi:Zn-dependent peptidase ImmA (M78 family)/transcriptional regulator with XRE-family HTH domain
MSIGDRIYSRRRMAGLSQRALAEQVGISAMAVSKYERNHMAPSSATLIRMAAALGVSPSSLLRPAAEVVLTETQFRCRKSVGRRNLQMILARAADRIQRYLEIEAILMSSCTPEVAACARQPIDSLDAVEDCADQLRREWGVGLGPIESLMELLEDHGIKVAPITAVDGFDALVVRLREDVPAVVVRRDLAGDRQRFTLAHELGHLILRCAPGVDPEKAANRFAGALLVPGGAARQELGARRSRLSVEELKSLKRKYGMSMAAWVYRARDLQIISEVESTRLFRYFRGKGWHREEPEPVEPERALKMDRLVQRGLSEGLISRMKAAELAE